MQFIEEVDRSTHELEAVLSAAGYGLNVDKTVQLMGLRGDGAWHDTRRARQAESLPGVLAKTGRYLGPHIGCQDTMREEVRRRIEESRRAWRACGQLWKSRLPKRVARILFQALVQGIAYSGMEAFVVDAASARRIDKVLVGMLRFLTAMRRCAPIVENKRRTAAQEFRSWGLCFTAVELRIRRVRLYPQWAAQPGHHRQVLAAVFSETVDDQRRGVQCLSEEGELVEGGSTPWAVQLAADFAALSELENVSEWAALRGSSLLESFQEGPVRDAFLQVDPEEMRARWLTVVVPPPPGSRGVVAWGGEVSSSGEEAEDVSAVVKKNVRFVLRRGAGCLRTIGFTTRDGMRCSRWL